MQLNLLLFIAIFTSALVEEEQHASDIFAPLPSPMRLASVWGCYDHTHHICKAQSVMRAVLSAPSAQQFTCLRSSWEITRLHPVGHSSALHSCKDQEWDKDQEQDRPIRRSSPHPGWKQPLLHHPLHENKLWRHKCILSCPDITHHHKVWCVLSPLWLFHSNSCSTLCH